MIQKTGSHSTTQNYYNLEEKTNESRKKENIDTKLETNKLADKLELTLRENEVKAHELAHKSIGAELAGAITYSFSKGPDGKQYITGGEVNIDVSEGDTPDETVEKMDKVIRAATAPKNPSTQDISVAQKARMILISAQQEAYKVQKDQEEAFKSGEPFTNYPKYIFQYA